MYFTKISQKDTLDISMYTFLEYLKTLSEMPMANYKYVPAPNQPQDADEMISGLGVGKGGWNDVDKILLQKDATFKKLEKVLERSTGHFFNILMLEYPGMMRTGKKFKSMKPLYKPYVEKYCKENGIPIEGHITFAKNESSGDPMKPWMILHTIGHALTEKYPQNKNEIDAILKEIATRQGKAHGYQVKDNEMNVLARIFKFSSAQRTIDQKTKKLQLDDFDELVHELFAEFLWFGKIRYQMPEEDLRKSYVDQDIHLAPWKGGDVGPDIEKIENYIKMTLDSTVGEIIIDHN